MMAKNSSCSSGDRAALACADGDAVDRAQRRDFGGGAGEENFVGDVQHLARNHLFAHGDAQVFAQSSMIELRVMPGRTLEASGGV